MINKKIKYFLIILISIIIYINLTVIYIEINFHDYVDIHSYLENIRLINQGQLSFFSLPKHYLMRFILPFVYYKTNSVVIFSIATYFFQLFSNFIFLINISKYAAIKISRENLVILSIVSCLAPGILFANVTMKSEWPSILIFGCCIFFIHSSNVAFKSMSIPLSLLARPSLLITVIYQFLIEFVTKNLFILFLFFTITPPLILYIFIKLWFYYYGYHFFETGYYTPFIKEYGIREFLKITNITEFWKIPFKIIFSLLLESNISLALRPFSNPENLNNLNGILRIIILSIITFKLFFNKLKLTKYYKIIFIYFSLVIPPIILTGFYQTRYFITADLILYLFITVNYFNDEKNYSKI